MTLTKVKNFHVQTSIFNHERILLKSTKTSGYIDDDADKGKKFSFSNFNV